MIVSVARGIPISNSKPVSIGILATENLVPYTLDDKFLLFWSFLFDNKDPQMSIAWLLAITCLLQYKVLWEAWNIGDTVGEKNSQNLSEYWPGDLILVPKFKIWHHWDIGTNLNI